MTQKNVTKKKAKPVDQAKPVIRKARGTDTAKVAVTRSITTVMKGTPQWNDPKIQSAQADWNAAADAIEATAKIMSDLKKRLSTVLATQLANRQAWNVATRQMTTNVEVVCKGSPDQVHALGFDVQTHVAASAQPAPSGVAAQPGTVSGVAVVTWHRGSARHGFLVQHAADVANPAAPIPYTKTKYTLEGAPALSTVHFRVAAIDTTSPTGASPWSDWVTCTVR